MMCGVSSLCRVHTRCKCKVRMLQGTEELPNDSERLWHGTADTSLCWVPAMGGAFSPSARAFAIDTKRVQGEGLDMLCLARCGHRSHVLLHTPLLPVVSQAQTSLLHLGCLLTTRCHVFAVQHFSSQAGD